MKILEKVSKCRSATTGSQSNYGKNSSSLKMDSEVFTGFKPAIEACYLDWDDYPMPGITYTQDINPMYHCPFTCFRHGTDSSRGESQVTQVSSKEYENIHRLTYAARITYLKFYVQEVFWLLFELFFFLVYVNSESPTNISLQILDFPTTIWLTYRFASLSIFQVV